MLTEKQLFELIKTLQSSNLSATQIFLLCLLAVTIALIINFLISLFSERAKSIVANANYQKLHEQLSNNTNTIKNIEKKISSELWISQQMWQKRYDMYESIYAQLLNIKKWVDNESQIADIYMMPHYITNSFNNYLTKEQEIELEEELRQAKSEIDRLTNDQEIKEKRKELQRKLSNAMTFLAEIMITKSILLNQEVTVVLDSLIKDIGSNPSPFDYEDPEDYGSRMTIAIDKALQAIKDIALMDLEIKK